MIPIFSAIRSMILGSLSVWDLGIFARKQIETSILPELRRKLESAREQDRLEIEGLIEEYSQYLDPSNAKSSVFGMTIRSLVKNAVNRAGLDEGEAEDFEQNVMMLLSSGPRLPANLKTDVMMGPKKLANLYYVILNLRVRELMRNRIRRAPDTIPRNKSDEIPETEAPTEVDEEYINQILVDLDKYMKSQLSRKPLLFKMFQIWLELARTKGPKGVDFKHDVGPQLVDWAGEHIPLQTLYSQWQQIVRPLIRGFFKKELDLEESMIRRIIGSNVVESVTRSEYRRLVARWVLGLT